MRTVLMLSICFGLCVLARAQDHRVSFSEPARIVGYASGVAVEWTTSFEEDVDYYVVLRRNAALERTVATLEPKGVGTGAYRYIDPTPHAEDLSFRLRVVFHDGAYADTDWLSAAQANGTRMRVLAALDEETLARLHLSVEVAQEQDVVVRVKSLRGEPLDTYVRTLKAGPNVVEIDYGNWPNGYYTVEIDDAQASMEWLVRVDGSQGSASTRKIPRS